MIPKFRAWDKESQTMLDVSLMDFKKSVLVGEHWKFGETNFMSFDDIKLMRSTGLKDKNDVEIFEGDVVKQEMLIPTSGIEEITGVVKMLEGAWTIVNNKKEIACHLWREGAEMEVIGNVWEGGDQNN